VRNMVAQVGKIFLPEDLFSIILLGRRGALGEEIELELALVHARPHFLPARDVAADDLNPTHA
jgi:hypothetical protein